MPKKSCKREQELLQEALAKGEEVDFKALVKKAKKKEGKGILASIGEAIFGAPNLDAQVEEYRMVGVNEGRDPPDFSDWLQEEKGIIIPPNERRTLNSQVEAYSMAWLDDGRDLSDFSVWLKEQESEKAKEMNSFLDREMRLDIPDDEGMIEEPQDYDESAHSKVARLLAVEQDKCAVIGQENIEAFTQCMAGAQTMADSFSLRLLRERSQDLVNLSNDDARKKRRVDELSGLVDYAQDRLSEMTRRNASDVLKLGELDRRVAELLEEKRALTDKLSANVQDNKFVCEDHIKTIQEGFDRQLDTLKKNFEAEKIQNQEEIRILKEARDTFEHDSKAKIQMIKDDAEAEKQAIKKSLQSDEQKNSQLEVSRINCQQDIENEKRMCAGAKVEFEARIQQVKDDEAREKQGLSELISNSRQEFEMVKAEFEKYKSTQEEMIRKLAEEKSDCEAQKTQYERLYETCNALHVDCAMSLETCQKGCEKKDNLTAKLSSIDRASVAEQAHINRIGGGNDLLSQIQNKKQLKAVGLDAGRRNSVARANTPPPDILNMKLAQRRGNIEDDEDWEM